MRVAIDGVAAARRDKTGVEWYAWHLLNALRNVTGNDEVEVWTHQASSLRLPREWRERELRMPRGCWKAGWTVALWRDRPDVVFEPSDALLWPTGLPLVSVVHDVAFCTDPGAYGFFERARLTWATRRAVRDSRHVIVPTSVVARDLETYFGVSLERVTVIPHGVDHAVYAPRPLSDQVQGRAAFGLKRPYIITVGGIDTRKGIGTLLEVYQMWEGKEEVDLVVVGSVRADGERYEKELRDTKGVVWIQNASNEQVAELLSGALCMATATRKEGFGMAVLEAMSCGAPVACSDLPVLREVAGDAAVFVSLDDVEAWRQVFDRAYKGDLNGYREKGLARANTYSWEASARATWKVLCGIL